MKPFIIGVAGGSGSGKSTVTEQIVRAVGADNVTVFIQDNFYIDRSSLTMEERDKINFDHPDALDWELMNKLFGDLTNGLPIEMPQYDFTSHTRKAETKSVLASKIIIVEGIFGLYSDEMVKRMALRIFVDTAADIRFMRRLKRDISERGRTVESVIEQYTKFVRPMYKKFVEHTKEYAHVILPNGSNKAALEMIVSRVLSAINNHNIAIDNDLFFEEE
ncbi:MAG: uridine kinase [Neisseriaceae bacterium]|nr:MAG: uridine kinase [Neisseriaceae bacterium]